MLAASTAGAFGLAGWSSSGPRDAVRSSAEALPCRLALALALVGPLVFARSLSAFEIVEAQRYSHVWYAVFQPVAFLVSVVALAVTTGGARSVRRSARASLAGYADAVVTSAIVVIVFLGGWSLPWTGGVLVALASAVVFAAKLVALVYSLAWVRRALERRGVPLEDLGWMWLVPAALANAALTALVFGVALAWRTPMGTGILAAVTDDGLWIGWVGYVYFLLASAATTAIVAGLVAAINRNASSVASCE
jgi:NADH-quinone oxidoreductase subunit H